MPLELVRQYRGIHSESWFPVQALDCVHDCVHDDHLLYSSRNEKKTCTKEILETDLADSHIFVHDLKIVVPTDLQCHLQMGSRCSPLRQHHHHGDKSSAVLEHVVENGRQLYVELIRQKQFVSTLHYLRLVSARTSSLSRRVWDYPKTSCSCLDENWNQAKASLTWKTFSCLGETVMT